MNLKGFNEAQNHKNVLKTEGYLLTTENGSTRQIKKNGGKSKNIIISTNAFL